jgi:hypothetical protein
MVQVLGTTYRIVEGGDSYDVIRLLDDRFVGSFRHGIAALEITRREIPAQTLEEIARHANRAARLRWSSGPTNGGRRWTTFMRRAAVTWGQTIDSLRLLLASLFRPALAPVPRPILCKAPIPRDAGASRSC